VAVGTSRNEPIFLGFRSGSHQRHPGRQFPKKGSSGLVERGDVSAVGTALRSSAPLRLCASALSSSQCVPTERPVKDEKAPATDSTRSSAPFLPTNCTPNRSVSPKNPPGTLIAGYPK